MHCFPQEVVGQRFLYERTNLRWKAIEASFWALHFVHTWNSLTVPLFRSRTVLWNSSSTRSH